MLGIFIFSSIPGEKMVPLRDVFVVNKVTNVLHVPAFTVLFILWFEALDGLLSNRRKRYLYAFAVTIIFGVFLEFFQIFVPGRYPSLSDILLNIFGAGLGIVITRWDIKKRALKIIKDIN
jgi:VanZ family protein